MSTLYPSEIDTIINLPDVTDLVTPVSASKLNVIRDALLAVEGEMGVEPSGVYTTIRARLDALEAGLNVAFTAAGDLSGNDLSQIVVGFQGNPISASVPLTKNILQWTGLEWEPQAPIVSILTCDDIAARNAISIHYRYEGLIVYVLNDGGAVARYYKLGSGLTNLDWSISNFVDPNEDIITTGIVQSGAVLTGLVNGTSVISPLFTFAGKSIWEGIDPPGASVSNTGEGIIYFDLSEGRFKISQDGGAYTDLVSGVYTAAGDLSGNSSSQVVEKIHGAVVPVAGALTTGHVLTVTNVADLTYAFLVDANVDASAAIAGTKISPDFGAQNIATTGMLTAGKAVLGTDPSTTGDIRLPNASTISIRAGGLGADLVAVSSSASNELFIGGNNAYGAQFATLRAYTSTSAAFGIGSTDYITFDGSAGVSLHGNAAIGDVTPAYGSGTGVLFVGDATVVPSSDPTDGSIVYSKLGTLKARQEDGTIIDVENHNISANGFRLSLTTDVPFTSADVTAASTLYMTPFTGGRISLYNGTSWVMMTTAQISLTLTGLTSGKNYDVFASQSGTTVVLSLGAAWTNDTTRATAIVYQDGVLVYTSDHTKRYIGTIRTTNTTTTEDSVAKRFVWNYYNRVVRTLARYETTDTWNTVSTTFLAANANSANCFEFVTGEMELVTAKVSTMYYTTFGAMGVAVGIGVDSTTVSSASLQGGATNASTYHLISCDYSEYPTVGYHKFTWLERVGGGGASTTTWYGDGGVPTYWKFGMIGTVRG